jgi:hypothetical protein
MTCRAYLFPPASSVIVMAASERSRVEAERQLAAAAERYRELSPRCGWAAAQLAGQHAPGTAARARRWRAPAVCDAAAREGHDAARGRRQRGRWLSGLLGGGWNRTGPRAWHDQACAELEARLAQARVPWEGIAMKRWGGA